MPPRINRQPSKRQRYSGPPDVAKALQEAKKELEEEQKKAAERNQQKEKSRKGEVRTPDERSPKVSFDSNATSGTGSGSGPRKTRSIKSTKKEDDTRSSKRSPKTSFDSKGGSGGGKQGNDTKSNKRFTIGSLGSKAIAWAKSRKSKKRSSDKDANGVLERKTKDTRMSDMRTVKGSFDTQSTRTGRSILKSSKKRRHGSRRRKKSAKKRKRKTRFHKEESVTRTVTPPASTLWATLASIHEMIMQRTHGKTKYRGRYATAIKMHVIFRILTDVQFGIFMESLTCLIALFYYLAATFQFFFGFHSVLFSHFFLGADFMFITELIVRLIIEICRHRMHLDFEFFFLPTSPKFWIVALVGIAPVEYCAWLFGFQTLSRLRMMDLLRFNRVIACMRIYYLFG